MPSDFIGSVNRRKKVVQESKETPRLKQEGEEEIREVYDLWTAYAHELGSKSGKIDRETVIEILAGIFFLPPFLLLYPPPVPRTLTRFLASFCTKRNPKIAVCPRDFPQSNANSSVSPSPLTEKMASP